MTLDYDLSSIQQARDLARQAKAAHEALGRFSEEQIEKILEAMVKAVEQNAEKLARLAVEETKYGVIEHKKTKNLFAAREVYSFMKSIKTTGIIKDCKETGIIEAAVPVGVVLGITPTTNPTSTVIHNALCAVKAGNAIVFAPHPNAVKCSSTAAKILNEAAVNAGAPAGIISCLTQATMKAVDELMHHEDIAVIVATGGSGMVRAAYSAGKPAFGVGPGNVPVFIERTADIKQAVSDIIASKTFDNGMICASEQAIIADEPIVSAVTVEFEKQGAYFLNSEQTERVGRVVMTPKGGMNAALVGQSARYIAQKAGIEVPSGVKLLIAPLAGYGTGYPLSHEKLTSVLAFYTARDWHEACSLSIGLLNLGGIGHTFSIHSSDEKVIREFMRKPVFRILVNTPSALGAIGYTTNLTPSLTLGCGTWGGSSISENLGPQHLVNVKRIAYGRPKAKVTKKSEMAFGTVDSVVIGDVVRQVLKQLQLQ